MDVMIIKAVIMAMILMALMVTWCWIMITKMMLTEIDTMLVVGIKVVMLIIFFVIKMDTQQVCVLQFNFIEV